MFYCAKNLVTKSVVPCVPWEFKIISPVSDEVRKNKSARQAWYQNAMTKHQFYTGMEAVNAQQRVSEENPVRQLNALVFDIDSPHSEEKILAYTSTLAFKPQWWERSLGGNWRAVFIFEEPILVDGNDFCSHLCKLAATKVLKINGHIPNVDQAYGRPTQLYCNGGEWHKLGDDVIPKHILTKLAMDAAKTFDMKVDSIYEIPMDVVYKECLKKYPNMDWPGAFDLECQGPSFWIPESTSPMSAVVKPGGMLTFADHAEKMFYNWGEILGEEFCKDYRAATIDNAVRNVYYDGERFWFFNDTEKRWDDLKKPDFMDRLKVMKGVSTKADKGGSSPLIEATTFIQNNHRVKGVCPNIFIKDTLIGSGDDRRLNNYVYNVMQPANDLTPWGPEGAFPFLSMVIERLFNPREQLPYFLAWFKTFYGQALNCNPCAGQNLFLQGKTGTGKTFLGRQIIGPAVGGWADASKYITGMDGFGGEIFARPLWCCDDETINASEEARIKFASYVKMTSSNNEHRYHVKFHQATSAMWNGRLFVTLNQDCVSSRSLVHLDDSTVQKNSFFQAECHLDFDWPAKREVLAMRDRELPFLLRWLINWPLPANIPRHPRFEIGSFQNEEMITNSLNASKAAPFKELLTETMARYFKEHKSAKEWSGTMTALRGLIFNYPDMEVVARQLKFEQLNRYLEMIHREGSFPCSVSYKKDRSRVWTFYRPESEDKAPEPTNQPPEGNFEDQ